MLIDANRIFLFPKGATSPENPGLTSGVRTQDSWEVANRHSLPLSERRHSSDRVLGRV